MVEIRQSYFRRTSVPVTGIFFDIETRNAMFLNDKKPTYLLAINLANVLHLKPREPLSP